MGGFSIAGPVLRFSIDENDFAAKVQALLADVSKQVTTQNKQIAQSISSQIANPLIAQAAQLRALYSTGSLAIKDLQTQQKNLLGLLDQEISKLVTRNDLSNKELSTLKALTLERERQQNALNRGTGVGVTAGTQSALGLVSGPIIANISRLGTGLLGIAGGSGGSSGGGAAFSGAAAGITAITASGGPAIAVLGALTAALVAAGGAAVSLAISGGALVQNLNNISQKTGISIQNLQVLQAAGSTVGLGLDELVTGFRKFSQALSGGDGLDTGDGSGGVAGATKKAAEVLQILGVTSKDSFTAIEQTADAFQKLPDGPLKAAAAIQLFGRSGLQLIPILNQGSAGVEKFRAIVEQFGPSIDQNAIQSQLNWQLATTKLGTAFDNLKVSAIPVLGVLTSLTTEAANFLNAINKGDTSGLNSFEKILFYASPFGAFTVGSGTGLSGISKSLDKTSASAVTAGSSLDQMFKIAEAGANRLNPNVKALTDLLNGTTDAIRKLQQEGAKELQQLTDEQTKAAITKLTDFTTKGQLAVPGATPADDILTKQRQDLEAIAEIVLNFPSLAGEAQAAVVGVTNTTITDLQKVADAALKKVDDEDSAAQDERIKNEKELNALILGVDNDLNIARAQSTRDAVATIIAEEQKRLDDTIAKATVLGATEQQLQDLRVAYNQEANDKIAKLRQDELDKTNKEVQQEAGQLFDALVHGGGSFTTALKNSLENLVLAPAKSVFTAVVGAIFTPFVQASKDALKNLGDQLKGQGGILGAIGKNLSPDTAIGKNSASVNLNTTSTDNNTQAINNLTGILTGTTPQKIPGSTAPSAGGGFGQVLFGGAGGAGGLILHGLPPSGGSGSASGPLSQLGSAGLGLNFLLGLGNLVGGISGHNAGQALGGGISLAGGALGKIGSALGNAGTISASAAGALGKVGGVIGGAGLVISGVSQGGIGGGLSSAIGGAEIGTAIAPGIGTAIGAIAGFAAGLIGGLFGHKGATASQINAAIARQTVDPNLSVGMEFDRSAQGTFAQTLASNFSSGPGGTFGNASIPSVPPPPPPTVNVNVSAIDAKGVAQFVTQYGQTIAKVVGGQINTTQSGLARGVRTAVSPA